MWYYFSGRFFAAERKVFFMNNAVAALLEKNFEKYAEELKLLIDKKSVRTAPEGEYPFGRGCAEVLDTAERILASHGFDMTNYGYYAGETDLGKEPVLMLLAHLDVVPEGDGWTREPYNMTREGDTVYGRGTTDDKGAALACIYAMEAVRDVLGEPKTGVRLVLGCAEETGSEDMEYYFAHRPVLDYTLSPDAQYPLINIEKGRFAPAYEKHFEKQTGKVRIERIDGGVTQNIVPGKAGALVTGIGADELKPLCESVAEKTGTRFTVSEKDGGAYVLCEGQTAHASTPEMGVNAQTALVEVLASLDTPLKETLTFLKNTFPHGETDGESLGIAQGDAESGALTLNFGVMKFDGERLSCNYDARCPVCSDDMSVKIPSDAVFESAGFAPSDDSHVRPAHVVDENSPLVVEALRVYEDVTGLKGECLAIGGGTYVHDIPGGIAFGIEFPGRDYHMHGADEFADVKEMLLTAKMYAQIIIDICY